jgi:hypothetical protein
VEGEGGGGHNAGITTVADFHKVVVWQCITEYSQHSMGGGEGGGG